LFTDGYHGHETPAAATDAAIGCRPPADLLRSKLDLHIADDDDVMSCSDDLQTDSSQNINDSDELRTSGKRISFCLKFILSWKLWELFMGVIYNFIRNKCNIKEETKREK